MRRPQIWKKSSTCKVWPWAIWIKVRKPSKRLPQHWRYPPFWTKIYLVKVPMNVNIVKQDLLHKKRFLKILWSEVWKGGFQLIQILGLMGMYFDAVVVEVETFLLLFRLALAILWLINVSKKIYLSVILYIWREDLFILNQLNIQILEV